MKQKWILVLLLVSFCGAVCAADGDSASGPAAQQPPPKKKQRVKAKIKPASATAPVAASPRPSADATPSAAPVAGAAAATGASTTPVVEASKSTSVEVAKSSGPENKAQTEWYTVVDGNKVDAKTLDGFRTWRAAACDRCHGPNQEGLVGPSLVNSLKILTQDDFKKTVTEGRQEKGMPSFQTSAQVMGNLDNLYRYLKGRSDGAIAKAKVEELK